MIAAGRLRDWALAGLVAALSLALYAGFALRLGQGAYSAYYILGFDFDPPPAVALLTGEPGPAFGFKHPLFELVRPFGLLLRQVTGLPDMQAAGLAAACAVAGSVGLMVLFLRAGRVPRPETAALATLFAVGATPVVVAAVPETYGFALFSLVLVWLLARLSQADTARLLPVRCAAAVFSAGITLTNAMQPALAEAALRLRRAAPGRGVPALVRFGLYCLVLFVAVAILLHAPTLLDAARHPGDTARSIWWLQTKGPVTGPIPVLTSFFVHSFVAPPPVTVPLEGMEMLDFRGWTYGPAGQAVALAWLAFLAAGTAGSLLDPAARPLSLALLAAVLGNVVLHLGFQFRGSLFIYAAHAHVPLFALAAGLAPLAARGRGTRVLYLGCTLALAAATAAVNLPAMHRFAASFDTVHTTCTRPCN